VGEAAVPIATTGRRRALTTLVLPAVGLGLAAVCGLVVLGIGTAQTGLIAVLVGAAAALILLGPVLAAFLWVDRWEPEPNRFLVAAFAWGAGISALFALLVNDTVRAVGQLIIGNGRGNVFAAVFSAPIVEEAVKGLFVLAILLLRRREFDGVIDGIVYAGVTAAGFAFTENIFYFAMAFDAGGLGDVSGGVVASFMLRGVLSPFVHPLFTALTGMGLGIAASTKVPWLRIGAPVLGFLGAVGLHALWNSSAALSGERFLTFYFLIMVPIFAGVVWLVVWQRRREQRTVARQLPGLAKHGVIPASEVGLLASLPGRRRWRAEVRRASGVQAARAVYRYQAAVTELAFLRHTAQRREAPRPALKQRQRQLIAEMTEARAVATGEQPTAPNRTGAA
jgi:RsiW-degrading membrane proteinase PrsW (M82 family)